MFSLKRLILSFIVLLFVFSCKENESKGDSSIITNPIQQLQKDLENYPDSFLLVENLIEAYRNSGNYDSALHLTDRYIQKDSGNAYFWNVKATLYFENEDTLQAIESLKHAIDIYPLPEYLVALGTIYAEIKNDNALTIANELLAANKTSSGKDAYFIKGLYYNFSGQPSTAITYLDSCLNNDYTYMYAYREKGIALYKMAKYTDAIKVLERAVTIQNNYDEGYYWLGKCYEKLNKIEDARQSYQNALLYDKNFTEARDALNHLPKK